MIIQNINTVAQTAQAAGRFTSEAPIPVSAPIDLPSASKVAPKEAAQQPTPAQLQHVLDSLNKSMQQSNRSMEFSVDANTKRLVVKLTDTETGQLIRQFPSEEVLAIAQSIDQYLSQHQGLLLKQKA